MNLNSLKSKRLRKDAGIALLTTILLLFLMSSLLVGFAVLLISNQQLAGANNDQVTAFYAAEAGMEKMTADLANLFSQTYSPSGTEITALETTPNGPPVPSLFPGESVTYTSADGSNGYTIVPSDTDSNGNPVAVPTIVKSGPYEGMNALATSYNLTVNARTSTGREVSLTRTTQTVGIPMFQFAIFCDVDCSFHAGDDYTVSGRVHGNGNLFLGSGATLTMEAKVDAYKDIIRAYMDNGLNTQTYWGGNVSITTTPTGGSYRNLGFNEGSWNGSSCIGTWTQVSTGGSPTDYGSELIDGKGSPNCANYSTGAQKLDLAVVTMGAGSTYPVDLIRRPKVGESSNVTGERYFAQSSLVILLSDNPTDITSLPCVEGTAPLDLSVLAQPNWWKNANVLAIPAYQNLVNKMTAYGTIPLPLPASGSTGGTAYSANDGYWLPANYPIVKGYIKIQAQTAYGTPCGTWTDVTAEVLALGYIGRNIDPVTQSLNGTSLNPQWAQNTTTMQAGAAPNLPSLPTTGQFGYQASTTGIPGSPSGNFTSASISTTANQYACPEPHPNAIIRLARIRDNPSSVYYNTGQLKTTAPTNYPYVSWIEEACGTASAGVLAQTRSGMSTGGVVGTASTWTPQPYDMWNNTLFDPREGELRDTVPANPYSNLPTLNGTMHYIEFDAGNLAKWFAGTIGSTGHSTYDPVNSPNDFSVYISDRRGNYVATSTQTWTGSWPPLSPSTHETGEYGWNDVVNSTNAASGCPNNALDTGEDLDGINQLLTYGANSTNVNYIMDPGSPTAENSLYTLNGGAITGTSTTGGLNGTGAYGEYGFYANLVTAGAILANPSCGTPTYASAAPGIWPMMYASSSNAARENPPIFFRRALKITDARNLTALGTCPSSIVCGLAIATENPVYLQGDYNANSAGNGFNDPDVGSSIAGDSVTILSNYWNDANSFSYALYANNPNARTPTTTYWRAAVIGGKGVSFPNFGSSADTGTDGGMHNFLREVEDWGATSGTVNYEGALVNLFTNRQADGFFKYGNTVYTVPTRFTTFDTNFLTPSELPPRTPMFREINTTGWTRVLSPNSSNYK